MKHTLGICVLITCILLITGAANAARPQWFGDVHDNDWFNALNWRDGLGGTGPVPAAGDEVIMNHVWGNDGPVIDKPGAEATQLKISEDREGLPAQDCKVNPGGVLTISDQVLLGYWGAEGILPANEGTLVINGGITNVANHVFIGFGGIGHLIVNGGEINIGHMLGWGWNGGSGTIEVNGGVLRSEEWNFAGSGSMNITNGTWVQEHYWVTQIQAAVAEGKIKAFGGNGVVNVGWDAVGQRTIVTAIPSLFDMSNITIKASSPVIVDQAQPGMFDLANMFEDGLSTDAKSTIFMNGSGAGAIYFVEFATNGPARVNTLNLHLEHDGTGTPQYNRAVRHFALKTKSAGSASYDTVVYETDVNVPYTGNVAHLDFTLAAPVVGQEFRAEFTGYTEQGVRVRELNATGKLLNAQVHLWKYPQTNVGVSSAAINNAGMFDLKNMFEGGVNTKETIFVDGGAAGAVYTVNYSTANPVQVMSLQLRATADQGTNARAIRHFKLKAKSVGSSTYDKVVYDTDVAIPYDANIFVGKVITLARPVIASQFSVEFTGNDAQGPRILELDAMGYVIADGIAGDLNGSYGVDFKDYSLLIKGFSGTAASRIVDTFESYTSLPNLSWSVVTNGITDPMINLATSGAHGGTKALKLNYDTADVFDPCAACSNTLSYDMSSTIDLSSASQFKFWVKRDPANQALPRFFVQFLNNSSVLAYSNNVPGTTADASGLWTEVVVYVRDLNMPGKSISSLKDINRIQFVISKGANQPGSTGVVYIDDLSIVNKLNGDINLDALVDWLDLSDLLDNWLTGK